MKSGIHLTTKAGKYQNTYLVCAKENEQHLLPQNDMECVQGR